MLTKYFILSDSKVIESDSHYELPTNPSSYYTEFWLTRIKWIPYTQSYYFNTVLIFHLFGIDDTYMYH